MIRKLHKDDIDSVANIWLNTNLQAHWFIDEQYWKKNYELVKGMLLEAEVYVYVEDNEVYGFIGINEEHIEGIFINSEAQSRGLGKSLLDFVKEKKERLHLNVYQKNTRAINFYKKYIGYSDINILKRFLSYLLGKDVLKEFLSNPQKKFGINLKNYFIH